MFKLYYRKRTSLRTSLKMRQTSSVIEQKTLIIIDSQVYNRFIFFYFAKKNLCNRIHASKKAPLNIFLEEEVSIHIYIPYIRELHKGENTPWMIMRFVLIIRSFIFCGVT